MIDTLWCGSTRLGEIEWTNHIILPFLLLLLLILLPKKNPKKYHSFIIKFIFMLGIFLTKKCAHLGQNNQYFLAKPIHPKLERRNPVLLNFFKNTLFYFLYFPFFWTFLTSFWLILDFFLGGGDFLNFFWIFFLDFLDIFWILGDFLGFFSKLERVLLKVTKVSTGN